MALDDEQRQYLVDRYISLRKDDPNVGLGLLMDDFRKRFTFCPSDNTIRTILRNEGVYSDEHYNNRQREYNEKLEKDYKRCGGDPVKFMRKRKFKNIDLAVACIRSHGWKIDRKKVCEFKGARGRPGERRY